MSQVEQIQNRLKNVAAIALIICGIYFIIGIYYHRLDLFYYIFPVAIIITLYYTYLLYNSRKGKVNKSGTMICIVICILIITWSILTSISFIYLSLKKSLDILEIIGIVNYTYYFITLIINIYILILLILLFKKS